MADFATRLRELRKKRGMRQIDLARSLGVAQTTIANYEKKLRFPDERMLDGFADFFDVSLDYLLGRSGAMRGPDGASVPVKPQLPAPFSAASAQYLELLRRKGVDAAMEVIEAASRDGMSVQKVYLDILEPALKEAGRLWEHGELPVGEEHAISEATQRIMSRIVPSSAATSPGSNQPRCLVLTVHGEQHTIGCIMVADFLRLDGWEVLLPLGNLSIRHAIEMLEERRPDLLAISATLTVRISDAEDLIAAVRARHSLRSLRIMAGGQAFQSVPYRGQEIGTDGVAADAESAVIMANRLVDRGRL